MPAIETRVYLNGEAARVNREGHLKLLGEVRALEAKVRANSAKSAKKFEERGTVTFLCCP